MLKQSNYNHFLRIGKTGDYLVYNSISNGLAKLPQDVYEKLKNENCGIQDLVGDKSKADIVRQLQNGHVIVNSDLDELEFLRTKINLGKFSQPHLGLTIATTLACNLGCVYCYENPQQGVVPSETLEDDIYEFVNSRLKVSGYKSVSITWYGGEPLLKKEFIFSLSKRLIKLCRENKVNYSSIVVTNGTLINKSIAERLRRYQVRSLQITVDGPKEVHDKRRPFKAAGKSSFDTIMTNIERIFGIIPISMRINVDKTNFSDVITLLSFMEKKGWLNDSQSFSSYIGFTREWTSNCSNMMPYCFSMREFSEAELMFQRMLIEKGYSVGGLAPYPSSLCSAVSPHAFVIDPGGGIHKCFTDVGNPDAYVGELKQPLKLSPKLLKWLSYDPTSSSSECRDCKFLPICWGGCPYLYIMKSKNLGEDSQYNCTPWKILMEEKITLFLEQRANEIDRR